MKLIFLDIDGVINLDIDWCQESIEILNEITNSTNAKLVISSDWKYEYSIDVLSNIFTNQGIKANIHRYTFNLVPRRAESLEKDRVAEINQFINENGVDNYLVIDDMPLDHFGIDNSKFIQTKPNMGLKEPGLKEKCIEILELK